MAATITKYLLPEFFEAIVQGDKKYELRLNDFEINPGDELVLIERDKAGVESGRKLSKQVTYVGKVDLDNLHWPKAEIEAKGLQIISFH